MERVAFLVESTGQRLGCLLNPESLVVRRRAGVRPRQSSAGPLTGAGLADDPLLYTGGGTTELELDLLFDVNLSDAAAPGASGKPTDEAQDVRTLTAPLWDLAENSARRDGEAASYGGPPLIRFVWGKAWNVPAVVAAVAERLESFTASGAPQRSWLRMRLLRVAEGAATATPTVGSGQERAEAAAGAAPLGMPASISAGTPGGGRPRATAVAGGSGDRIDVIASRHLGDPAAWRRVAAHNDIADPLRIAIGTLLHIPPPGAGSRPESSIQEEGG